MVSTLRKDEKIPLSFSSPNLTHFCVSHLQSAIDHLVDDSQQALLLQQQQQQQQQQLHRRLGLGAISEESGVEAMRRERELLIRRIQTLESRVNSGKGEAGPGGIVHSVQIKNGGNGGEAELGHQVNIEINPPKQQQQKQQQQQVPPPHQRYSHPSPKVSSVVNLVNSGQQQQPQQQGFHPEEPRGARQRTGSFSSNAVKGLLPSSGVVRPTKMVPSSAGRIAVPSAVGSRIGGRLLSNNRILNPKSRSVENLFDGSQVFINLGFYRNSRKMGKIPNFVKSSITLSIPKVLGLKSANSEMNVTRLGGSTRHLAPAAGAAPHGNRQQQGRLRGTISEMNVSRIGTNEKVICLSILHGNMSQLTLT